ncbi:unnamed protein product, partial [Sphenostylis stenocarpa]
LTGSPGEGKSFLELVNWNPEFAKSVIEERAEEESERLGIRVRPSFNVELPAGFVLKKEIREWVRDCMELDYVSPYEDVPHLDQASREMEKRSVEVFHELLSLFLHKRVPVPILGKFCDEYRFSNAFSSTFTRHSGIFYLSLKGRIGTTVLREAYRVEELVDRDPLLQIKDKFVELLEEGWRQRKEQLRLKQEKIKEDMELLATKEFDNTVLQIDLKSNLQYITWRQQNVENKFVEQSCMLRSGKVVALWLRGYRFKSKEYSLLARGDKAACIHLTSISYLRERKRYKMKRVKVFNLMNLAMTFLAFVPKMESQVLPPPSLHPLCLSQLALVGYACTVLPLTTTPGPPPPSPSPNDHGHRSNEHYNLQENCCHWAKEIDSQCVCEVLVRLPTFLTRPMHQYSISIGESCNVTYSCGGPI